MSSHDNRVSKDLQAICVIDALNEHSCLSVRCPKVQKLGFVEEFSSSFKSLGGVGEVVGKERGERVLVTCINSFNDLRS